MKFSVAPESTSTCLSALECAVLNRVGTRRLLYLHLKTLLIPKVHAQTDGLAPFKNPLHLVTILPRAPQKSPQNDNTTKTHDLKRHARDIAHNSHGIEDEIRAMVSSYMAPKDDEDQELAIGQLVC